MMTTHAPDQNLLFKFIRPEYLDDFLDGKIYMELNKYFINLEEKEGKKGVGDKHDGSMLRFIDPLNSKISIGVGDGKFVDIKFKNAFYAEKQKGIENVPVTCFTVINVNDFEEAEENLYKIKRYIINGLSSSGIFSGRKGVLINSKEFFDRLENVLKENKYNYRYGIVKYFDEYKENNITTEEYDNNPFAALFYKRKFFENQKEFRLILKHAFESAVTLELGNIRDICHVFEAEKIGDYIRINHEKIED